MPVDWNQQWTRIGSCLEATLVLFFGAVVSVSVIGPPIAAMGLILKLLSLAVPIFASLLFLLCALAVPNLLGESRLGWPLNLTLPPIFAILSLAVVEIGTTTGNSLVTGPDLLVFVRFPTEPKVMAIVGVIQCILITLIGLARRQREAK